MSGPVVGRLHVLTDEQLQSRWTHVEIAGMAAEGGADVVQFRDKRFRETAELTATARAILERLAGTATRLIVNDRCDVAAAVGAAGVHLGADDLDPESARRLLGPRALVGATAHDVRRARLVDAEPIDYLGVGPVFGTASKARPAAALGLDGLRRIAAAVSRPVIAIGNITPERVADVIEAGAQGIAVLSDVLRAIDPRARVAELAAALDRAPSERLHR